MRPVRAEAERLIAAGELHESLTALLEAGLSVVGGGVFFTRELDTNGHLRTGDTDITGQEALINKVHLDDLVDTGTAGGRRTALLRESYSRAVFLRPPR